MSGISEKSNLQKITSQELESHIKSRKRIENLDILGDVVIINSITDTLDFFNCKFSSLSIYIELEGLAIYNCDFERIVIERDILVFKSIFLNTNNYPPLNFHAY